MNPQDHFVTHREIDIRFGEMDKRVDALKETHRSQSTNVALLLSVLALLVSIVTAFHK